MVHEKGTIYFDEPKGWQVVCANCGAVSSVQWRRYGHSGEPYLAMDNPPAYRYTECSECWQIHVQEIPENPVMLESAVEGDGDE